MKKDKFVIVCILLGLAMATLGLYRIWEMGRAIKETERLKVEMAGDLEQIISNLEEVGNELEDTKKLLKKIAQDEKIEQKQKQGVSK